MASLDDIAAFVAVADAGGLAAAETVTGQPRANLSRALKRLETRLGTTLARRSPQSFSLTDDGVRYLGDARAALEALERAETALEGGARRATVRITAPTLLGHTVLARALATYRAARPDVRVVLHVSNEKIDLIGERIDIALRTGDAKGEALVARTLFHATEKLYASAEHLVRMGRPLHPNDLRDRGVIHCTPSTTFAHKPVWTLTNGREQQRIELRDALIVNDPGTACRLAHHGAGIARITDFLGDASVEDGTLEAVLPDWSTPDVPVRAVLMDGRGAAEPVKALVETLVEAAKAGV